MIDDLAAYPWSSYHHNALGQTDGLITEHQLYKALGDDDKQCCESYKNMFARRNSAEQESQITDATLRGEVYGSNGFHRKISSVITRATKLSRHGGDRKSELYNNQAG